ncbi:hypothetical protein MTO98_20110 [Mucilaginibacter sp. SMC90]|uniref:hypothetical protein n=1 Tax=Mucilaginibacter sp. SMC90 TaxID=2929803 RepID=UPI001FB303EA|nr:hypothetical protein [Mucilaginibacter sp. SMC90]UOE46713.1 hypothetical protein MTO98_20110 [Mucilaginibacter sp. SMC90]
MKVPASLIVFLLIFISCRHVEKKSAEIVKTDAMSSVPKATDTINGLPKTTEPVLEQQDSLRNSNWVDTLIVDYIEHSDNELIKLSRKDTSIHDGWMFDRLQKRGVNTYFVYNIGHDYNNGDGVIYASDGWVYIDTLNRKLYEYQVTDESLKEWKH